MRMFIEEKISNSLIHEFHRDCDRARWFKYDQFYCWLAQCVIDQINTDIPWHTGICEDVAKEIEALLAEEFLHVDYDTEPDDAGFMRAVDLTKSVLSALMETAAYSDFRDVISGCLEDYNFEGVRLVELDFQISKLTLEIIQ